MTDHEEPDHDFRPRLMAPTSSSLGRPRARRWRFQYRNSCVRFVFGVAAASRNTRFQGARYGFTLGRTLHRLIAPALPGAFPLTSSARTSSVGGTSRPSTFAAAG
jgi:hypothetical protein